MTDTTEHAARISLLLAPAGAQPPARDLPTVDTLRGWVDAHLAKHGCGRPPPGADDEADVRHALYWLLRMAGRTYQSLLAPPPEPDPELARRFSALLGVRPEREEEHAQLHVDPSSSLRRAAHVAAHVARHPGPVLAVGDDDAVTLALALMGVPDLHAVDIDERILAFLDESAREIGARIDVTRVDVLDEPLPAHLRRRCAAAIADPIRSLEPTLGFLLFGAAALRRDAPARLFWADHPDWTFEHAEVVSSLARAGIVVVETHEALHGYPLDEGVLDSARIARELGADEGWIRALVRETTAWSDLYVLEREAR